LTVFWGQARDNNAICDWCSVYRNLCLPNRWPRRMRSGSTSSSAARKSARCHGGKSGRRFSCCPINNTCRCAWWCRLRGCPHLIRTSGALGGLASSQGAVRWDLLPHADRSVSCEGMSARLGLGWRDAEIQRALDCPSAVECSVRVYHCRLDVLMTQQFLNRADVKPCLKHVGRERVPQRVRRDELRDASSSCSGADCSLYHTPVEGIAVRCIR
jgi:hypothetical protein